MSQPQPTVVLVKRLRRLARALDLQADLASAAERDTARVAQIRARANVCWQAAGRLDDFVVTHGDLDHD